MQSSNSIKEKTTAGLFWSFADLMANHGIQFLIQIILARLLLPEHFGIIGMIIILIAISNTIVDSGFSQALIRDQHTDQTDYSTVFYCNVLIAMVLYFLLFISSASISRFFEVPQLQAIIRVISLVLLINSLTIIQRVILIKKIDFKTITKIGFISAIVSGAVTISAAVFGLGVWSLVIHTLCMQFLQMCLLWFHNRWMPSITFSRASFKKYYTFGYKLLLSGLIDTFYHNLFFLLIGKFYSVAQLGYYSNAVKLKDNAVLAMTVTVQRVSFPVLSTIQEDDNQLKSGYRKIIKTTAFLNFPVMTGLIAVAHPLFILVLGEKWIPSIIYFQLLCAAGMLYPINAINLDILKVRGRSDIFLLIEIITKLILTLLIVLSLWFAFGIIGLIGAAIISSYINLWINNHFTAKEIAYSRKEQLLDIAPVYVISIVMGAAVYMAGFIFPDIFVVKLMMQIGTGMLLYFFICKLCKVRELDTVLKMAYVLLTKIRLHFIKKTAS